MRLPAALLSVFSAFALAQEQKPLIAQARGWLDSARSYLTSSAPATATDAAAAAVASKAVTPLTASNWASVLAPQKIPTEWLVLITGGNRTCAGMCNGVDAAFNKTAARLAPDLKAPKLAKIDCDTYGPTCTSWWAAPVTVWHIEVPALAEKEAAKVKGGEQAPTKITATGLNVTTATAQEITELYTLDKWKEGDAVEGYFHPFDGPIARFGLMGPFGQAADALGRIPPWMLMLVISFITRSMM